MKWFISLWLVFFLAAAPAYGSYTFGANEGSCTVVGTSCSPTAFTPTTGGMFVVGLRGSNAVTINVPSDTKGNTYNCGAQFTGGTSTTSVRICWASNVAAGSTTATCSISASATLTCDWVLYTGEPIGCNATLGDGTQKTGSQNAGTSLLSSSYTTTATDLLVAVSAIGATNSGWAAGAIFGTTSTMRFPANSGTATRLQIEDRLNIAAGTGTAASSWTGSTDGDMVFQGFLPSCPSTSVVFEEDNWAAPQTIPIPDSTFIIYGIAYGLAIGIYEERRRARKTIGPLGVDLSDQRLRRFVPIAKARSEASKLV